MEGPPATMNRLSAAPATILITDHSRLRRPLASFGFIDRGVRLASERG